MKITSAAEVMGSKMFVNDAVHPACAEHIITRFDLDGPSFCGADYLNCRSEFNEKTITVSDAPGITGFESGRLMRYID